MHNHDKTTPETAEPQTTTTSDAPEVDGIDRRNFLSCMAWAGTGLLWTIAGGIPTSRLFAATAAPTQQRQPPQAQSR